MNIFLNCLYSLAVLTTLNASRDWENWKDEHVTQLIHEFWIRSPSELNHRQSLAQLVKSLYLPGDHFLEAGCGSGLVYSHLVPQVMDNPYYIGIDITQNMLDIAHKDYPEGIFLKDDLFNLSFEDKSFEIVAAFEVLGHLPDIVIPIREMVRVASRLVIFTVWTSDSTSVTEERFASSQFIHAIYSHTDIMQAIASATNGSYTVQVIPLNVQTTAYVLHSKGSQNVATLSP
jgi:ubiquinone/menaquinone biosynthesis C-methylase UbiE